jgi:hypothetical protein
MGLIAPKSDDKSVYSANCLVVDNIIVGGTSSTDTFAVTCATQRSIFIGNHISAFQTGTPNIFLSAAMVLAGNISLINNVIEYTTDYLGVSLLLFGGNTEISNNYISSIGLFSWNEASNILFYGGVPKILSITNNIFEFGYSDEGSIIGLDGANNLAYILNNDFQNHGTGSIIDFSGSAPDIDDPTTLNACAWAGCSQAGGNFSADPALDPSYHISDTSACRDAGIDPSPFIRSDAIYMDFEGDFRPHGANWDVGPDENVN